MVLVLPVLVNLAGLLPLPYVAFSILSFLSYSMSIPIAELLLFPSATSFFKSNVA